MALTKVSGTGLKDDCITSAHMSAVITNADIASNAAIALSKLGTSGTAGSGNFLRGDGAWTAIDLSSKLSLAGGTMTGHLLFGDAIAAKFGASTDLQIEHTGSNSTITDSGAGKLILKSDNQIELVASNNESMIEAVVDGAVNLFHNGTKKFNTHADGIEVLGKLYMGDSKNIELGNSQDLKIFHDGSNSQIREEGTGNLMLISNNQIRFEKASPGEAIASFNVDGACELYYDNSLKLSTASGGVNVAGNLNMNGADSYELRLGAGNDLKLYHDGSSSYISHAGGGNLHIQTAGGTDEDIIIKAKDAIFLQPADGEAGVSIAANGSVELYHNNVLTFQTESDGASIIGPEGSSAFLTFKADEGDDNADLFDIGVNNGGPFSIQNKASGSWETNLKCIGNGAVELYYDNSLKLSTYGSGVSLEDHLWLKDSKELRVGDGSDLKIYHSGSHSYIQDQGTGNLYVLSNQFEVLNAAGNEAQLRCTQDGGTLLFHNNVSRLETTSSGVSVSGTVTCSALNAPSLVANMATNGYNINVGDSTSGVAFRNRIRLGDDNDLQIFHDGNHSYIDEVGTGNLYIDANQFYIRNNDTSNVLLYTTSGGAVRLNHNGSTKLETWSGGATVTGGFFSSETNGTSFKAEDGGKFIAGGGNDLQLFHDGTRSHIYNTTGDLRIRSDDVTIRGVNDEICAAFYENSSVELYYDNSKKFNTNSAGVAVHGDISLGTDNYKIKLGTSEDLKIYHSGTHSYIDDAGTGGLLLRSNNFHVTNAAGTESIIHTVENGAVELYYDNSKKFQTYNGGVEVFGDCSLGDNKVLNIGTGSDLQIYHNGSSSVIKDAGTGGLQIITNDLSIANAANSESLIQAYQDGAVNLFYNGSKKLETTSSGVSITGDLSVSGSVGGAGKILQVITTTITGQQSGTNNSDSTENTTDLTGFSLNITPSSTSSKILLMASVSHSSTNWSFCIHAYRDSTIIAQGDALGGNRTQYTWLCAAARDHNDANTATTFHIIDSPSSTSQITYKLKGCSRGTNSTWNINKAARHGQYNTGWIQSCVSTFTLMEIG